MPSVEELLSVAEADTSTRNASDSRIEIDADTRIIQMMPQDELFGVESDEKSERKYFKVPKIVGNGVDLSKLQLRINYQNASKLSSGKDMYIVKDATVYNDEWVYFSWELSRKVTLYKGTIYFVVCAVKADSNGHITNEWNTTLAMGKVLEGLEVETSQEQQYQASDYLEMLKQQLLQYSEQIKGTFPSDYTETVENVKNLQSDVKKLDDNKITKFYTSNQGQKVLNDSDDGKIQDLMIYGKSEQKQYTGINLFNYIKATITTDAGITFAYDEESQTYKVNGTATKQTVKNLLLPTKNIYAGKKIVGCPAGGDRNKYVIMVSYLDTEGAWKKESYDIGNGYIIEDYPKIYIQIMIASGMVANNLVFKPMITEDTTKTYDDFEPYTGGKPSPSPEFPQEIKAVVNPTIKTHGKNLIDFRKAKGGSGDGVTFIVNADGSVKKRGTATGAVGNVWFLGRYATTEPQDKDVIITLKKGKKYYVSDCTLFGVEHGSAVQYGSVIHPIAKEVKVTGIRNSNLEIGVTYDDMIYPMIVESEPEAEWQPYQETQATLPYDLYAIPVSSGGNVTIDGQQYIADYVDIEKGVLVRNVAYGNVLDLFHIESVNEGDVKWWDSSTSDMVDMRRNSNYAFSENVMGLFSTLKSYGFSEFYGKKIAMGIMNFQSYLIINMPKNYGLTTKQKWEDFLKDSKILKSLNNSVEIKLTQDQIEAFKALSTYYPKTYISAESEQLEAYTMFNYPVSMEKGWEYVKQQISDDRKYIYDMDTKLTETEASTLEAKIDTAILSEMVGG